MYYKKSQNFTRVQETTAHATIQITIYYNIKYSE